MSDEEMRNRRRGNRREPRKRSGDIVIGSINLSAQREQDTIDVVIPPRLGKERRRLKVFREIRLARCRNKNEFDPSSPQLASEIECLAIQHIDIEKYKSEIMKFHHATGISCRRDDHRRLSRTLLYRSAKVASDEGFIFHDHYVSCAVHGEGMPSQIRGSSKKPSYADVNRCSEAELFAGANIYKKIIMSFCPEGRRFSDKAMVPTLMNPIAETYSVLFRHPLIQSNSPTLFLVGTDQP